MACFSKETSYGFIQQTGARDTYPVWISLLSRLGIEYADFPGCDVITPDSRTEYDWPALPRTCRLFGRWEITDILTLEGFFAKPPNA